MNRSTAKLLASMVGDIVELSNDPKDFWGKYLRVRVWVDVSKPLCRGLKVWVVEVGMMITVLLKYERLPEFCHNCGLLGHPLRECMEVVPGPSELKYGAWLKASPHVRPRVFSFRTFNTNRESSDNVFQEAKNVYGEFSIDNHANSGKKSSSSEEIPAVIPVKQVLIGVQGAVCNSKVLSNPVGLESVRTENILEGDIVPFSCVGSNTILSVEDCGEVAETIAVKEVDIDKDVGKGFVQSLGRGRFVIFSLMILARRRGKLIHLLTWLLYRGLSLLCGGDFNEILFSSEKKRGSDKAISDLGFSGDSMTWNNKRRGVGNVQERLDRFLANSQWKLMFPRFSIENLEIYWQQRSRADWMVGGDKNTKFFHARASARRKKNEIVKIVDDKGVCFDDEVGILKTVSDFFSSLFKSSNPSDEDLEAASCNLRRKVYGDLLGILFADFSTEDIKAAKGCYNVKSGYKLAVAEKFKERSSCSLVDQKWWLNLWNMRLPQKIKIFTWKVCKNALPSLSNLVLRKINCVDKCPRCGLGSETVEHALLWCPGIKVVWEISGFWSLLKCFKLMKCVDFLRWLVSKVNSLAYELKKVRSAEEIVSSASFLLQDFQHSMDSLAAVPLVKFVALAVSRWEAPPPGSLKLNCDAAVKVDSPCVGLGAVIRNSSGQVVLASCKV
ncbi:hypothetical protein ACOSP7_005131 [Xanthoceras sorbifolium]